MLPTFIENLNVGSIRVHPPRAFILLCGGVVETIHNPPASLRDHYLRKALAKGEIKAELIQIEEINEYYNKDAPYDDFVDFERDIAQLSELVLLFSESPGSFAELGTFSSFIEIYEKTLVVIRIKHANGTGFIARGPLEKLRKISPRSVYTISDGEYNIVESNISEVNSELLHDRLKNPIAQRLEEARERTTLNLNRFNHRAKFYTALLQEFTVLKDCEIFETFAALGSPLTAEQLDRIAFCSAAFTWTRTATDGFDRIHFATPGKSAASWSFVSEAEDTERRRAKQRKFWEETDPSRMASWKDAAKP